jgi:hypothetical protein
MFWGTESARGLAAFVTVKTQGQVNVNTADCVALAAHNVSEAECQSLLVTRRDGPIVTVPGPLGGRGLSVTTRTYRIEAEGIIEGQVRARLTAIVQRRASASGDDVVVLEWSGVR